MRVKGMYQNYIFDLYGTLVDIHTDEQSPSFWKKFSCYMAMKGAAYQAEKLALEYTGEIQKQKSTLPTGAEVDLGKVFQRLYEKKGVAVSTQEVADTAMIFRTLSLKKLCLFDGVTEMLSDLKNAGKKVYLLSNAQALFTMPELRMLGLEPYFDGILLSSDVGYKKPSEKFYHTLLDRYGLKKEESVMVGNDDQADCWGAHSVGLDSIYIYTEQSPERRMPLPENCREIRKIRQVFEESDR